MSGHDLSLVGLIGNAGSGKNYIGNILWKYYRYIPWSLALSIKQAVYSRNKIHTPYELLDAKEKSPSLRQLLQNVGTEEGRDVYGDDVWIRSLEITLHEFNKYLSQEFCGVVLTDIRFPNEADFVWQRGGRVVRVLDKELDLSYEMYKHRSESLVDTIEPDHIIDNTGHPSETNLLRQLEVFIGMGSNP